MTIKKCQCKIFNDDQIELIVSWKLGFDTEYNRDLTRYDSLSFSSARFFKSSSIRLSFYFQSAFILLSFYLASSRSFLSSKGLRSRSTSRGSSGTTNNMQAARELYFTDSSILAEPRSIAFDINVDGFPGKPIVAVAANCVHPVL